MVEPGYDDYLLLGPHLEITVPVQCRDICLSYLYRPSTCGDLTKQGHVLRPDIYKVTSASCFQRV